MQQDTSAFKFQVQQILMGGSQCGGKGCGCSGAPACPQAQNSKLNNNAVYRL